MIKTQSLYILGSGGMAKEIVCLIEDISAHGNHKYKLEGFIDLHDGSVTVAKQEYAVLSEKSFLNRLTDINDNKLVALVNGIGNPQYVPKAVKPFTNHPKCEFPNLIHPSFIGMKSGIEWGVGNVVTAGCIFTNDISIGSFNIFNRGTQVGHDCKIGSCNILNPGAILSGRVQIGNWNLIGTHATVLQTLVIGDDVVVGGGATVTKNLENGNVYVGTPAKFFKKTEIKHQ